MPCLSNDRCLNNITHDTPKFLLAWSEVNWLWLYSRLRPARNERWSLLRVLGLTALAFAAGAACGLGLALVLMRQPVGWLPWLLGLAGDCLGLCWFGVTALCWNQRAAQLHANPALPTGLPKARLPFFRWCLGLVYFVILGVLAPCALFITVENIRGEMTWKREHARLMAAGEKLTFREILGPDIPATQNAGAAPVFAPLFDYQHHPPRLVRGDHRGDYFGSGSVWLQSNRLAQLEQAFKMPSGYLPKAVKNTAAETPRINLTNWSAAYRAAVVKANGDDTAWASALKLPPPGDPARDVLAGLSGAEQDSEAICAAAALPRSQFPLHYEEGFEALLRHVSLLRAAQQTLQLRCAAHLGAGETDAAFADATNALNVAELLREEPLLISQLVRYAQGSIAVSTLWQGLADHCWSEAQLAEFQRRMGQMDYLPGLLLAFEGERAAGIMGMDQLIHEPPARTRGLVEGLGIPHSLRSIPRGMLRQNQASLAHYESAVLVGLRKGISNAPQSGLMALIQSDEAKLEKRVPQTYSPYAVLVAMLAPGTSKAVDKTSRMQTLVKLAIVACALERYRLAHESYPEKLQQLAPQFVDVVPRDPMVNQPFRYQRTDDGWFQLYSVGPNGHDDGGLMRSAERSDTEDKDWPWPVPTRPMHPRLF